MARKKKEDIVKEKVINDVVSLQERALVKMRDSSVSLHKSVADLMIKIDYKGTSGYYSVDSDILKYAESIWSSSLRLAELKRLEDDLKGTFHPKRLTQILKDK
tara:strand:+ start:470 stop:778 length:309 start_codon:yes stop_codon:yes gene_type:complete